MINEFWLETGIPGVAETYSAGEPALPGGQWHTFGSMAHWMGPSQLDTTCGSGSPVQAAINQTLNSRNHKLNRDSVEYH